MNGAERRCGDFVDSSERANICAEPAQTSDASSATTRCIGRSELAPTTAVPVHAQTKYSKRVRDAYGYHRSTPGRPPRTSITRSPPLPTERPRNAEWPHLIGTLQDSTDDPHQRTHTFPTNIPLTAPLWATASTRAKCAPSCGTSSGECTRLNKSSPWTNLSIGQGAPNPIPVPATAHTDCNNVMHRYLTVDLRLLAHSSDERPHRPTRIEFAMTTTVGPITPETANPFETAGIPLPAPTSSSHSPFPNRPNT